MHNPFTAAVTRFAAGTGSMVVASITVIITDGNAFIGT